ncbi:hypothetical protein CH063_14132, partial [Colletotrichum higginsianum]
TLSDTVPSAELFNSSRELSALRSANTGNSLNYQHRQIYSVSFSKSFGLQRIIIGAAENRGNTPPGCRLHGLIHTRISTTPCAQNCTRLGVLSCPRRRWN